jgi:hypothetical protein
VAGLSKVLTAIVGKRPLIRPRPSATLSPREREKVIAHHPSRAQHCISPFPRAECVPHLLLNTEGADATDAIEPQGRNNEAQANGLGSRTPSVKP